MAMLSIFERLRQETDTVVLAFSGGKDSLALLDVLQRQGFQVFPYYMYAIPGLSFVEKGLQAAEARAGITITRLPHPGFADEMRTGHYRQRIPDFPRLDFVEIRDYMRLEAGTEWVVEGYKKRDSLERRAMIAETANNWGPENEGLNFDRMVAWPLANWQDSDVFSYLRSRRIPLPADYDGHGTGNWGGALIGGWLQWIYEHYPEDFKIIERYYPHVKAALLRDLSHRGVRN